MLSRIKLGPKLIGSFLLVSLCCAYLGWEGNSSLQNLYQAFDETNNNTVPTLLGLQIMSDGQVHIARNHRTRALKAQLKDANATRNAQAEYKKSWE